MEVTIEDIPVMYVIAEGGAAGAKQAFDRLEARLPTLRGRRFYGAYYPRANEYRACVALQPGDNPVAVGLDTWVIPGGSYVREKMKDWTARVADIGKAFVSMTDREGARVDCGRPSIEFYRSQAELILLLPVKTKR